MDIVSIYTTLANWTGWPITFLIFIILASLAYWTLSNRIGLLQDHKDFLETQLADAKNFQPDVVALRLSERHKYLTEAVELLHGDNEKNKEEINTKEFELEKTKNELQLLKQRLETANDLLKGYLPRAGIVDAVLLQHFLLNAQLSSAIYIPIWLWPASIDIPNDLSVANELTPFKIISDAGMHKFRLGLIGNDGRMIGEISNPFDNAGIYNNDYHTTLDFLLSQLNEKTVVKLSDSNSSFLLKPDAVLVSCSGIFEKDSLDFFLKIPVSREDIWDSLNLRERLLV